MAEIEKLKRIIEGMKVCNSRDESHPGCSTGQPDCPYGKMVMDCTDRLFADAIEALEEVLREKADQQNRHTPTHGDLIRASSDEDLAREAVFGKLGMKGLLRRCPPGSDDACPAGIEMTDKKCLEHWIGWFNQPATGGEMSDVSCPLDEVRFECADPNECMNSDCEKCDQNKPEGVPVELVDCIIRIMDIFGRYKIDLQAVIDAKMKFNATRPHKHGKAF